MLRGLDARRGEASRQLYGARKSECFTTDRTEYLIRH